MRTTILLAALLTVGVLLLFTNLILLASRTASAKSALSPSVAGGKVVPPLASLIKEREEEKSQKTVFHSKGTPPKIKIFQTSYKEGTQVTFNHAKHVETYGLNCIECHHVENCGKCHLKGETHTMEVAKGKQALHENCIGCHAESKGPENCPDCHKQ